MSAEIIRFEDFRPMDEATLTSRFEDLHGVRPLEHPQLMRDEYGEAVLEVDVVLVKTGYAPTLWVIKRVCGDYLLLAPYGKTGEGPMKLHIGVIRQTMLVWDDYRDFQVDLERTRRGLYNTYKSFEPEYHLGLPDLSDP